MKTFIATFFFFLLSHNCFSQDTLANPTRTRDAIQLYNKKHSIWSNPNFLWNRPIFKMGDDIYNANELKPIIGTNKKAYASFKAFRFNYTTGTIVSLMTAGSTFGLVNNIINKRPVLLPIGAIIGTYLLSDMYFKSSRKQLNKALLIYNSN